jgi:outer membrane protein assembly factor BamD (BamD/ComL family)
MRIGILLAATALALVACSSGKAPPPQAQAPTPPEKTIYDTQIKALQRAKDVQKTVDKQKADADKKLDDAGG